MSQRKRNNKPASQHTSSQGEASSSSQDDSTTDLANKCVRYIITRMHSHIPIKKSDIVKNVLSKGSHRAYERIISKTREILDDVYGLRLECIDSDSVKRYVVSNALPPLEDLDITEDKSFKKVVTFLVLAHIYLSRNSATDLSLWKFLKELEIPGDYKIEEELTVEHFVTKILVQQQFICMEQRGGEHDNGQLKMKYSWGPHAIHTISKRAVLDFVADIYGTKPEYWKDLYEESEEAQNVQLGN